ncbi:HNH/ENDO VII family nuclease [Micromonospora sp. WMMD812]|uniref:HNH/ENDO VII family nuclease n=1 Tax=Micromonospora sp. WMMD812 TaxID=3015152 RepID=UPI00248D0CF1|nr:HNH/ENDO VII family nuclease [Micromonospora sp. WMMD812]WBB70071.1 HNH/ENDO VII family nuclease [Micromonospora sp. WMMD812]
MGRRRGSGSSSGSGGSGRTSGGSGGRGRQDPPEQPSGGGPLLPAAGAQVRPQRRKYRPNDPADPAVLAENRPKLRTTTKRAVFKDAKRAPNGEDFVCPNSGAIIPCKRDADGNALLFNDRGQPDPNGYTHPVDNPPSTSGQPAVYHFGHVEDAEYRRLIQVVEDHPGTVTNKQFRDEYNNPDHYQVEDPPTNVSHGSESTAPGYGHYDHMVPQQTTTTDSTAAATGNGGSSPSGSTEPMDTSRPRIRR